MKINIVTICVALSMFVLSAFPVLAEGVTANLTAKGQVFTDVTKTQVRLVNLSAFFDTPSGVALCEAVAKTGSPENLLANKEVGEGLWVTSEGFGGNIVFTCSRDTASSLHDITAP